MLNQIVVVEGKTDSQKLKKIFGDKLQTLETNGLALNQKTIDSIKKLSENNEIIIFTDPDGPGKKIRETIIKEVNKNVYNAFINKKNFTSQDKKIGVAEANEEEIKKALNNFIEYNVNNESISWIEYKQNDIYLKSNRNKISKKLEINLELSSKSLFKWLNWMNLDVNSIRKILEE
ncbi:ribonuclease M5 [Entomoplasma ellychniae]|uniref:Ribonuclease M5 n=2 Tax=Entomoplasma ellychniae TaxID=2114 RepID=A0A8E2QW59_9MOLU|nr:ribonuclease M5 [Entomoplasma ellychniae]PPE04797.1 ribonuclease M5 [Entomoplasma ellychniae]